MFDYPGLAAQLYTIAQAVHFPHEYMVHVLQIAELGQWKGIQDNQGTLSYRELARRGKDIERVLLGQVMPNSGCVIIHLDLWNSLKLYLDQHCTTPIPWRTMVTAIPAIRLWVKQFP